MNLNGLPNRQQIKARMLPTRPFPWPSPPSPACTSDVSATLSACLHANMACVPRVPSLALKIAGRAWRRQIGSARYPAGGQAELWTPTFQAGSPLAYLCCREEDVLALAGQGERLAGASQPLVLEGCHEGPEKAQVAAMSRPS